jgi:tRNA (cmo5U34)-methyltransferase
MSEKLITSNKKLNKIMIDEYYEFKKKMGYSEYEIAQKREALENVLIPYTMEENIEMLKNAGFKEVEVIFRWNNFATFMAFKN